MTPKDEGVIKYDRSYYTKTPPLLASEFSKIEKWRKRLHILKLIGEYEKDKLGFGNISERQDFSKLYQTSNPQFVISGTQTGKLPNLSGEHYTRVVDCNIETLKIVTMGPVEASSEALTHASIYECNQRIKAVFHIHNREIWSGMIEHGHRMFTSEIIPYGTIEMARAVRECVGFRPEGTIVMRGHEDGVIAFGPGVTSVGELVLELYRKFVGKIPSGVF